jgi:hypothetical protein
MATADSSFQLMTALVYRADSPADPFPLLARHFTRLRRAHAALAEERPDCWCASRSMPNDDAMLAALQEAVARVQGEGMKGDLRVRSPPTSWLEHDHDQGRLTLFTLKDTLDCQGRWAAQGRSFPARADAVMYLLLPFWPQKSLCSQPF